ncbi:MAG: O-antigen ligase family protein [Defluviitaleaceae bacterium]|nr:O-antigen ligase family protein [Defluviitaleaceae bacterium]
MGTTSFIIKKIIAVLNWLNFYFEHSLIFRGLNAMGNAAKGSRILAGFKSTDYRDFWQGSIIMRTIRFVVTGIIVVIGWFFRILTRANASSVNKRLFESFIMPLKTATGFVDAMVGFIFGTLMVNAFASSGIPGRIFGGVAFAIFICDLLCPGFWTKALVNCAPVRLVKWFFQEEPAPAAETSLENLPQDTATPIFNQGVNKYFKYLYLVFGVAAGMLLQVLPLTHFVLLAGGAGVAVFTFFNLRISYMFFILGALMTPGPMWNNAFLLLGAIFYAGVFAIKWFLHYSNSAEPNLAERFNWCFNKCSPALIIFVFFCALSIFTGFGGMDSVRVFVIFFACVVHSLLVACIFKNFADVKLFFKIAAFALAAVSLFGFYQFTLGIEIRPELVDLGVNPGLSRLYSTLGNPNNDAKAWAMLLPFVLAVAITVKNDTKRLILIGAIFICIAAFALTYSRAGYVALIAGVGVFVLMSVPRLVPVGLLFLVLALPFIPASILDRLLTLGQDTSSQYRFLIWGGVFRMLEDFWVQGIGMGPAAFVTIYRGYAHPAAERALHSHNMFLDLLVHSGIGALLAFIAYLFRLFKQAVSAHIAAADKSFKMFTAAAVASLTVFVVFGVGEYVWFYPRVMLVFWVCTGFLLSLAQQPRLGT